MRDLVAELTELRLHGMVSAWSICKLRMPAHLLHHDGWSSICCKPNIPTVQFALETGNESYRFQHSSMAAKGRIKAREQKRKRGGQIGSDGETG